MTVPTHHSSSSRHKLLLWGAGQMSTEIQTELAQDSAYNHTFELIGAVGSQTPHQHVLEQLNTADLLIDFSHAHATAQLARLLDQGYAHQLNGVLVGTTALSEANIITLRQWAEHHAVPTVLAANTSVGVFTFYHLIKSLMSMLGDKGFDIELVESHHNKKHDAPSGTAKLLLSAVTNHPLHNKSQGAHPKASPRESGHVGVHAIRGGGIYGHHELQFISQHEVLTVAHSALSRALFAKGALTIATKLLSLPGGFYYLHELPADFLE